MIKSILVPMGSSIFSQAALKTAVKLANSLDAELRLLYVEDIRKMAAVLIAYRGASGVSLDLSTLKLEQEELKAIGDEIEKEKLEVQKYYDAVKGDIRGAHSLTIREGSVPDEIPKEIRRADLVVMGKSLQKGTEECGQVPHALMRVIHKTNRSLLAVCSEMSLDGPVLICYDGSRTANHSLRILADLRPFMANHIAVLTVARSEEEANPLLDEAEAYLASHRIKTERLWRSGHGSGHTAEIIVQTAQEKKVSLIVMGGYGDNLMKEILVGSVTERILRSTDIAVLLSNQ
jgi:nucleotide-binding universal stress UspA family protein